jgi:hypothetical protein
MQENVTLLAPPGAAVDTPRNSTGLPPDLLQDVRRRVRLLALLLFIAFAFEPVLFSLIWAVGHLVGRPVTFGRPGFVWADALVAAASAAVWWVARQERVSPARLHTLGLIYQVVICSTSPSRPCGSGRWRPGSCRRSPGCRP